MSTSLQVTLLLDFKELYPEIWQNPSLIPKLLNLEYSLLRVGAVERGLEGNNDRYCNELICLLDVLIKTYIISFERAKS